ncbi:MAG: hypothetical protein QOE61_1268, partial [Micromonosporaceae bacterium]|nr:hypothetical protein [Micromonosporaceae bacterium]
MPVAATAARTLVPEADMSVPTVTAVP